MRSALFIVIASLSLCACAQDDKRLYADNPAVLSSGVSAGASSSTGVYAMGVATPSSQGTYVRQADCADGVNDAITHLEQLMAQSQHAQNQKAPE